jgi:hypothetical protein
MNGESREAVMLDFESFRSTRRSLIRTLPLTLAARAYAANGIMHYNRCCIQARGVSLSIGVSAKIPLFWIYILFQFDCRDASAFARRCFLAKLRVGRRLISAGSISGGSISAGSIRIREWSGDETSSFRGRINLMMK